MSLERNWQFVQSSFISDGTLRGTFQVGSTVGFYVGQLINLSSTIQPEIQLKIKRIDSDGTIHVGSLDKGILDRTPIAQFLVADSSVAIANEQVKSKVPKVDQDAASYESEPINARRVLPIDNTGNSYGKNNPIPVSGTFTSTSSGLAPSNFDDIKIIRNINGDPTRYQFFLLGVSVGNIDVFYDSFGASEYRKA